MLKGTLTRFRRCTRGGIAVTFALALPVLLGIVGVASDYAMMSKLRAELQEIADASAMAGAREIPLSMSDPAHVASAVRSFAAYRLTNDASANAAKLADQKLALSVDVVDDFSAVQVKISEEWTPFFIHFIKKGVTPITVTSHARFVGRNNICVLGLAGSGSAVYLDKDSRIIGNDCGVFSNSTGASGLRIDSGVVAKASIFCSAAGTAVSGSANVTPKPITDCPPVDDPLASRSAPSDNGCSYNNVDLKDVTKTLSPGTYCGGLLIRGTSKITLNPGIYIIRDGALKVVDTATLNGKGVGFFITGAAQATFFSPGSHISLEAPNAGAMAGLLLFEDRALGSKLKHRISSNDARMLLGTIYLPVGGLIVDAKQPVADQSAYTAIVTQTMELNFGPNLILNSNYKATDVPVPAGIAGSSQVVLMN